MSVKIAKIIFGLMFAFIVISLSVYYKLHVIDRKNMTSQNDNNKSTKGNDKKLAEFIETGLAKAIRKDYQGAIDWFTKVIEKDNRSADAYYYRGLIKLVIDDNDGAISDFNKINMYKDIRIGFYDEGIANYWQSIKDFDRVITLNPNNAIAFKIRGDYKAIIHHYKWALKDYNTALELNPKYDEVYLFRGELKNRQEDYRGAEEEYTKAIKLKPDNAKAYLERGNVRISLNDTKGAFADWEKAKNTIGIESEMAEIKLSKYKNARRDKKASEEFKKAIKELIEKYQESQEY